MDQEGQNNDIRQASRSANVSSFIDDFTALTDFREFKWSFEEFCLPELVLKKNNLSCKERSFLDVFVKVDNKWMISLFL